MKIVQLEPIEAQSALWRRLRDHMSAEIQSLRDDLERPLTPEQTATVRAKVFAYRSLLALEASPAQLRVPQVPGQQR